MKEKLIKLKNEFARKIYKGCKLSTIIKTIAYICGSKQPIRLVLPQFNLTHSGLPMQLLQHINDCENRAKYNHRDKHYEKECIIPYGLPYIVIKTDIVGNSVVVYAKTTFLLKQQYQCHEKPHSHNNDLFKKNPHGKIQNE